MFPSIKKNPFQDKVESEKSTMNVATKALIGLVATSAVSFASTTLPASNLDNSSFTKQDQVGQDFVLKSAVSPTTVAWHESHVSHESHSSHTSSSY